MISSYPCLPSPRSVLTLVLAACLALSLGACATSGGTATADGEGTATATTGKRGVVSDTPETTKRRMRLQIQFPDFREVVDMLEGQKVTYNQPDGTYVIVPSISKSEVGRVEVDVQRQALGGGTEEASATFFLKEPFFFHLEFQELDWPSISVEVLRVHPPLRPGL